MATFTREPGYRRPSSPGPREQGPRPPPQLDRLEAVLLQQAPQRPPGEEADVRGEWVGDADDGRVRGRRDRRLPAGPQDAAYLREEQLHVAHVLDRLRAEHQVEGVVGEGQALVRLDVH